MTSLLSQLENLVGQNITSICDGKFHQANHNHCAHFVSHVVGLTFAFNCQQYQGGSGTPANIRVQEIFAECGLVGHWADADLSQSQLIFVTRKSNVDLARKHMRNIPQKHVGVFCQGSVYHYSNTQKCVVKASVGEYFNEFSQKYRGVQGLFFGSLPHRELQLTVKPSNTVTHGYAFALNQQGKSWFADKSTNNSEPFLVGRETSRAPYIGLYMRAQDYYGPQYRAQDYLSLCDHFAQLLELSGYCESQNYFNVINTYDSAKFTFGFYQLGAHTADDNLILLFRRLLQLANAADYFPELALVDGRVHRVKANGMQTDLEVETASGPRGRRQLQRFMDFLNAERLEHDEQEVLQSARCIHWSNHDAAHRRAQVDIASEILQKKMTSRYQPWYDLDGKSDVVCALIADIHHQGRASKRRVQQALASADVINNLITINAQYQGRIRDLNFKLQSMIAEGQLGQKVYHAGLNEFIDA
ncbi:MAG: hypothetical protein HWE11_12820 [Gammaproteobacteria bacterium]|nr:hypothetical protein [Gammaproteobacteria bacterium]